MKNVFCLGDVFVCGKAVEDYEKYLMNIKYKNIYGKGEGDVFDKHKKIIENILNQK